MRLLLSITAFSLFSLSVCADENSAFIQSIEKAANFKIQSVEESTIDGLYELITDKGLFYVDKSGEHMIAGNVYRLKNGMKNLTSITKSKLAVDRFNVIQDSFITYKAEKELHEVVIFTDTSKGIKGSETDESPRKVQ